MKFSLLRLLVFSGIVGWLAAGTATGMRLAPDMLIGGMLGLFGAFLSLLAVCGAWSASGDIEKTLRGQTEDDE